MNMMYLYFLSGWMSLCVMVKCWIDDIFVNGHGAMNPLTIFVYHLWTGFLFFFRSEAVHAFWSWTALPDWCAGMQGRSCWWTAGGCSTLYMLDLMYRLKLWIHWPMTYICNTVIIYFLDYWLGLYWLQQLGKWWCRSQVAWLLTFEAPWGDKRTYEKKDYIRFRMFRLNHGLCACFVCLFRFVCLFLL